MTNLSRVNVSAQTSNGIAKKERKEELKELQLQQQQQKLDDFQDLIQMELLKKIEFQLIEKMLLQILSIENSFPCPKYFSLT